MAKDPAFLFYSADFIVGTYEMTDEQVGRYIRLMCLQHQKGHLSESVVLSVMGGEIDREVIGKLKRDDDGLYYNERLEEETNKRKKYSESRAKNRKGKAVSKSHDNHMSNICNSYDEHMVNENEDVNDIIINTKESKISKTFVPEPILMLSDLSKKYKSDELWIASVTKTLSLKRMEAVSSLIDKFLIHLETQKTTEKTEKDFREHFVNWARKQNHDSKQPANTYTPPIDHG